MLRRSQRQPLRAMNPEERTVPLIERTRTGHTNLTDVPAPSSRGEVTPNSYQAPPVQETEAIMSHAPESAAVIPNSSQRLPMQQIDAIMDDATDTTQDSAETVLHLVARAGQRTIIVDEPFTDDNLQQLLRRASNLGYNFDKNLVSGTPAEEGAAAPSTDGDPSIEPDTAAGDTGCNVDSGATGCNAENTDDARMEHDVAESAVAISLKGSDNQFMLDVISTSLGPSPTVDDVLRVMKGRTDPNTRAMSKELEQIPQGDITAGTARKPVSLRILDQYAGDAVVGYRSLGTLEDAVNEAMALEPCIDCAETEDLRNFRTPPIPSSTPVFILYCRRQEFPSNRSSLPVTLPNSNPEVAVSNEKLPPTMEATISRYLETVMDLQTMQRFQTHVLQHRHTHRAFSTIVQARLVESVCNEIGINYESGNSRSHKCVTSHGQSVSVDDVVLFFAEKTPPNRVKGRGSAIAPTTFTNHRSWHLRANACIIQWAGKTITSELHKQHLELVKKLLLTDLSELQTLQPGEHGSWDEFKNRVIFLEGASLNTNT